MRYLGIDYGAKRIGLAISDENGTIAFPETSIPNDSKALGEIASLIHEKEIGSIVMGDTRAANGIPNPVTADADRFAGILEEELKISVERIFEAWSSIEASRFATDAGHNDAAAAAIILQRYLEIHPETHT